jgi:hypothetical protein
LIRRSAGVQNAQAAATTCRMTVPVRYMQPCEPARAGARSAATCAPHLGQQSREVIARSATRQLGTVAPGQVQLPVVSLAERCGSHGIRHFKLDAWRSGRPTPLGEAPASGLGAVTLNRTRQSSMSFPGQGVGVQIPVVPRVGVQTYLSCGLNRVNGLVRSGFHAQDAASDEPCRPLEAEHGPGVVPLPTKRIRAYERSGPGVPVDRAGWPAGMPARRGDLGGGRGGTGIPAR